MSDFSHPLTKQYNTHLSIIPCHRVIGKNGQLTGYGGGLARKEYLLAHEKKYSAHNSCNKIQSP